MFSFMFSVFQYTAIFRKRKSFYPIPAIAVSSFSTPASAITSTGFHFVFRRRIRQITKIPTIIQRVSASAMASPRSRRQIPESIRPQTRSSPRQPVAETVRRSATDPFSDISGTARQVTLPKCMKAKYIPLWKPLLPGFRRSWFRQRLRN